MSSAPPPTEAKLLVSKKCVRADEIPAVPKTVMSPAGDVKQLAAGAAADMLAFEEYAARADAIMKACAR